MPITPQPAPVPVAPETVASKPVAPEPVAAPRAQPAAPRTESASRPAAPETSIVAPLPSPKDVPEYANQRPSAELSLQPETDVAQIQPDVIPPFPEPHQAGTGDAQVLKTVNEWAAAWARGDAEAYLGAYDAEFAPQGGGSRTDWEKNRRVLLGVTRNVSIKVDSPSVSRGDDGSAAVTFNQIYRADNYSDTVVKQLRLVERGGRWLIVEEKVLSIQGGARP